MSRAAPLALVTGPSRGIGRATAAALAERGVRLALVGRMSAALEAAQSDCLASGAPEVRLFPADLADLSAAAHTGAAVIADYGVPDVVIHNAGVARRDAIEQLSLEAWREQIDVNLGAPYALTRALLPAMRARGSGRFVFVGSISGTLGTARQSAYSASKWGVIGFMKSLAEELRDSGLSACAVLPGSVSTDMLEGSGFPPRMTARDVAKTLVFHALDAPLAHNGALIEMFGV
jgi:3-oxoacyl-[acyl-carrier protein] reductase